ncbi:MAG TPA: ATP-binding protein [Chloroflexota bacterium]|nr:ATP-binding protein [Chloroflexota bacterium]
MSTTAARRGEKTGHSSAQEVQGSVDLTSDPELPDYGQAFRQFMEQDARGLLVVNSRRSVLELNPAARMLLGYEGQVPCRVGDAIRDVNAGFAIGDAIHDRRKVTHEAFLPDPDRILVFEIVPILDPGGQALYAIVSVTDVTRLRHLETVRRDFVANVSHELRTPLASINLLVETLASGADAEPDARAHFLHRIQVETHSMNRLVEELLELSRLESGRLSLQLEAVELGHVVDEVMSRLAMAAEEKGVHLVADVQSGLAPILADPSALEQVLMNLVHNAIKFTPAGGSATVRARRDGRSAHVEVVDTGVGMTRGQAARIFERFYKVDEGRSRDQGTGLGLAIARHLLSLHGSNLRVVSEEGRGSRFIFVLPFA